MDLNPKFVFLSPARDSEPGARATIAEHVDHAIIALDGRAPVGGTCTVELLEPLFGADVLRVELWVSDLDDTTCTYGFLCSSDDGRTPYARGERCVVNVDPHSRRVERWSRDYVASHEALRKDLPAYA
ncbi:MAG TPA: thioesterase family protein [Thermoanaerobaculia bacterium]|jgi:acyl-CoA thioesterase FadM